jgi:protein TonB
MFEDSLVISQVQSTSSAGRWTALVSISLQFSLAALIIALPLLHPEKLAFHSNTPRLFMPPPPKPPQPIEHVRSSSVSSSKPTLTTTQSTTTSSIHKLPSQQGDDTSPIFTIATGKGMADGIPLNLGIGNITNGPRIAVVPVKAATSPVRISSGVSSGMLIAPIRPIYPSIARVAQVEGTVVVEAVISRAGTIESLHVVSGPAMLRQAALDAIRVARYQPYRLNDSPTEVQTTITVNFRLGS